MDVAQCRSLRVRRKTQRKRKYYSTQDARQKSEGSYLYNHPWDANVFAISLATALAIRSVSPSAFCFIFVMPDTAVVLPARPRPPPFRQRPAFWNFPKLP